MIISVSPRADQRKISFNFTRGTDLTLVVNGFLVKVMRMNPTQIRTLAHRILQSWKEQGGAILKAKDDVLEKKIAEIIKAEFQLEEELDREVHAVLDQLEQSNPGEFQRYKMFPLLKKKMAKEKGIVL